jgi:hypothetical protein
LNVGLWLQDIETLEAISQDEAAREIILRMAVLASEGRTGRFLDELGDDRDLDDPTKGALAELATDEGFLLAFLDYVRRTARVH